MSERCASSNALGRECVTNIWPRLALQTRQFFVEWLLSPPRRQSAGLASSSRSMRRRRRSFGEATENARAWHRASPDAAITGEFNAFVLGDKSCSVAACLCHGLAQVLTLLHNDMMGLTITGSSMRDRILISHWNYHTKTDTLTRFY